MLSPSSKRLSLHALLLLSGAIASCSTQPKSPQQATEDPWKLIWADEFEGDQIKPHWEHQTFPGIDSGNKELQHYTDRPVNSFMADGMLHIRAVEEDYREHNYTSARLTTAKHFSFRYGRVEARAKIPSTKGIWPAIWMMPTDSVYGGWPHSGEIDILESVNTANEIYGTIHYGNPGHVHQGAPFRFPDWTENQLFSDDFHVYAIEWEPEEIRWYVDGIHFGTQNEWQTKAAPYPAPFDQDFHLIVNVAVGGNWPGPTDETSVFPQEMLVDYVRVYQTDNELPELTVHSPANGAQLPANTPIPVEFEAYDPDGDISRVRITRGSKIIAEDSDPPFDLVISGLEDGCYDNLHVYAYDNSGMRSRQDLTLTIGRGCPQEPFTEVILIPGSWEAEDFDKGIEGEAYHDSDSTNSGHHYRPESGVDISATADEKTTYIGWTEPGEWLDYHASVEQAGMYEIHIRAAAMSESRLGLAVESAAPVSVSISPTGDWDTFQDFVGDETIELPSGAVILRLSIIEAGVNIDRIELRPAE